MFGKNEINLVDKLDRRIKFIDAIASEEFAVSLMLIDMLFI